MSQKHHDRKESVHLHEQMAVCDGNYIRLLKLLPVMRMAAGRKSLHELPDTGRERSILIPGKGTTGDMQVTLRISEHFRYTTELEVVQLLPFDKGHYRTPTMLVRLYHDARSAEVVSYQQQRIRWQPSDDAGRPGWHGLSLEKMQLNAFLGEWLALCLAQGLAPRSELTSVETS